MGYGIRPVTQSAGAIITIVVWLAALLATPKLAAADDELFGIDRLETLGRVVTARFADFNGDGRKDLMIATLEGIPPSELRKIHVYLQEASGGFPPRANHSVRIPRWSAVYDVADLRDSPGDELVLLRPDRVTILSLASAEATQWDLPVGGASTVAASDDERGFDPLRLVYDEFDDEPWLLVPQIGALSILAADGTLIASIDVGRRANYYVAKQSGLVAVESDIQLFLDAPKVTVGDVDGDGLADIIAATRHEIRVFLQNAEGRFARDPSYALPLGFISNADHARGSGAIVTTARDFDGDGRLDLMITHVEGSFIDTVTRTYLYRNNDGIWDLAEADARLESDGTLSSDFLIDTDSDGALELVRVQMKFSVLELVEFLLTRRFDVRVLVHRLDESGRYSDKPWSKKKVSTAVSFDTFRPKGFMPTSGIDLNADGLIDFVSSANGKGIEVYLGTADGLFAKRSRQQKLSSVGVIRFADFDGDDLPDFVLYDPQSFDAPVRIGRNTGLLPGTPELGGG